MLLCFEGVSGRLDQIAMRIVSFLRYDFIVCVLDSHGVGTVIVVSGQHRTGSLIEKVITEFFHAQQGAGAVVRFADIGVVICVILHNGVGTVGLILGGDAACMFAVGIVKIFGSFRQFIPVVVVFGVHRVVVQIVDGKIVSTVLVIPDGLGTGLLAAFIIQIFGVVSQLSGFVILLTVQHVAVPIVVIGGVAVIVSLRGVVSDSPETQHIFYILRNTVVVAGTALADDDVLVDVCKCANLTVFANFCFGIDIC